jgi:hypothetical protein
MSLDRGVMITDSNIDKNHSVMQKPTKPVWFLRFTENRSVTIKKIKF